MNEADSKTTTPSVAGATGDQPLPPLYPPMTELAFWLQKIYGLTVTEIRDVILDLRSISPNFRVSYSADEDKIIRGWPDWDVNWKTFRARRKNPGGRIDYPLTVSWEAAERAVKRVRRDRLASSAPAPNRSTKPIVKHPGGRPEKWDWIAFAAEMVRLANTPDGLDGRPAVTKLMKQWCMDNWGDEPSDSMIHDKMSVLYPDAS